MQRLRLSLLALPLLLLACDSQEPAETAPASKDPVPTQITYAYKTVQTRDGIAQWDLLGQSAAGYEGDPLLHLSGVNMVFYQDGVEEANLEAETGEIDEKTNNTSAFGNVIVVTVDGRVLKSEVLHWDNARELIHTDAYFELSEGDQLLTGYGLETDPNLTDLTIRERVEGHKPSQDATEDGKK